jgi:hypothetical protein
MNQQAQPNQIAVNVAARKKAEALFRTMIDLTRDEVNKLSPVEKFLFIECGCAFFNRQLAKQVERQVERQADQASPAREEGSASRPRATAKSAQPVRLNQLDLPCHVQSFIDDLNALIELCDEVPLAGADFASSVAASAADMIGTVEEMGIVTDAQIRAYENWHGGVSRWLR